MLLEESLSIKNATVAPLVLLSVVDHYNRVAQNSKKRAVGVLLGTKSGATVRVANSFAVPFDEDEKTPGVWFLDHNYVEAMGDMFKKVNAKEKLIGWYHSGPKLRPSDLSINEVFKKYTPSPLMLIVDVKPDPHSAGLPTEAFVAIDEIRDDGTRSERAFVHIPSSIQAEEAEEIGVEHLLRDVRDAAAGSLSTRIHNNITSLLGLQTRLQNLVVYLEKVQTGLVPANHAILAQLQDVYNLLRNLPPSSADTGACARPSELAKAFTVKTNDELMVVYLSSLVRAIVAFHNLIENKIENKKYNEKKILVAEAVALD